MSQVNKKAENAETVVNAVSKTDEFFNKNKKLLIGLLTAVVVIAAGSYTASRRLVFPSPLFPQMQLIFGENSSS